MTCRPGEPRNGSPFSNSTEGEAWMDAWCHTCLRDKGSRGQGEQGEQCPLVLTALLQMTPAEWTETSPRSLEGRYDCSWYEADPEEVPAGSRPWPQPEPLTHGFYVTATYRGKTLQLLGPYAEPQRAEANQDRARLWVSRKDPKAWEYVFAIGEYEAHEGRSLPRGIFTRRLGLEEAEPTT